jgi:hypothetical protein
MAALAPDRIRQLATEVHDYESFGHVIVGFLLNSAAGHVQKKENLSTDGQMVTFNVQATVEDHNGCIRCCIPGAGCILVCLKE